MCVIARRVGVSYTKILRDKTMNDKQNYPLALKSKIIDEKY